MLYQTVLAPGVPWPYYGAELVAKVEPRITAKRFTHTTLSIREIRAKKLIELLQSGPRTIAQLARLLDCSEACAYKGVTNHRTAGNVLISNRKERALDMNIAMTYEWRTK